jgi:integrase
MDERRSRDFSKGPVWDELTNRWHVEIRYPDASRLRRRFRREREALRFWSAEETKIADGGWKSPAQKSPQLTFGAALDLYSAHAKLHVPSYASYTEPALKVWRAGICSTTRLGDVTPGMIDAVKLRRATEVKKASVDRNLQVLRRVFNWAIEQGLTNDNPVRRVKFFRAETRRLRYLTEDEYRRLLAKASEVSRSPLLREAIELAVHTGLRRGNLLGLQWDWVDWRIRVVRVPRTKSGKPQAVPLNRAAWAVLQRLWKARGESSCVFAHTAGRSAGQALLDLKKGFHTALDNAGIEDFRWHDLRHTFASWLVMRGASVRAVGELLGHQTIQMTMRYAHLSPGYLSREIGLLDGVGKSERPRRSDRVAEKSRGRRESRRAGESKAQISKRAKKGQPAVSGNPPIENPNKTGAPCRTRTCDLLVRSQTLYPTELRAREHSTIPNPERSPAIPPKGLIFVPGPRGEPGYS